MTLVLRMCITSSSPVFTKKAFRSLDVAQQIFTRKVCVRTCNCCCKKFDVTKIVVGIAGGEKKAWQLKTHMSCQLWVRGGRLGSGWETPHLGYATPTRCSSRDRQTS